eukprot:Skav218206  [mRNA]  locus=scaffold2232:163590:163877:- [translate_table: standard]
MKRPPRPFPICPLSTFTCAMAISCHFFLFRRISGVDVAGDLLSLWLNKRKSEMKRVPPRHHGLDAIHSISCFIGDNTHSLAPVLWRQFLDPWLTF